MFYSISLAVGIILVVLSFYFLKQSLHFIKSSEKASGTVIGLERVPGSDGDTYKAIFKFRTYNNKEVIYREKSSSSPAAWSVGEDARFAYQRDDPSNAKLLTYFGSFGWTVILLAIAMPLLVIGGGYFIAQPILKQLYNGL